MLAALLATGSAVGASARVAVVHSGDQDEAARRLGAELSTSDLDVVDVRLARTDARDTMTIVGDLGAVGVLRINRSSEIEVVVLDPETGRALAREVLSGSSGSTESVELRAVEALRAKLVKLSIVSPSQAAPSSLDATAHADNAARSKAESDAERPPGPVAAPVATAPSVPPDAGAQAPSNPRSTTHSPRLWVQGAIGAEGSAGGLSASPVARVGLELEPTDRWAVDVLALLPFSPHRVETAQGHAEMNAYVLGATLGARVFQAEAWSAQLALGAGAVVTHTAGFPAASSEEGKTETLVVPTGLGAAALNFSATAWLRLRLDANIGVCTRRATIRFEGQDVASWGVPWFSGALGFEVDPISAFQGRGG